MKWCVLSKDNDDDHYRYVSNTLNANGCANTYEYLKTDNLETKLKEIGTKFDFILIGNDFLESVVSSIPKTYVDMNYSSSIDGLLKDKDGSMWPAQFLSHALVNWISAECKDVGVTNPALVVGSGGLARAVIAGLAKAGFTNIVVADTKTEKTVSMINDLQKMYFNLHLQVCPKEQITLLPGVHSICINTVSIFDDPALFQELFYCNFIKRGGVVLDMNCHPIETPLLKLSKGIAGKLFPGFKFWAYHDREWLARVFKYQVDLQTHAEELKSIFSKRTFDESKLSQILDL